MTLKVVSVEFEYHTRLVDALYLEIAGYVFTATSDEEAETESRLFAFEIGHPEAHSLFIRRKGPQPRDWIVNL